MSQLHSTRKCQGLGGHCVPRAQAPSRTMPWGYTARTGTHQGCRVDMAPRPCKGHSVRATPSDHRVGVHMTSWEKQATKEPLWLLASICKLCTLPPSLSLLPSLHVTHSVTFSLRLSACSGIPYTCSIPGKEKSRPTDVGPIKEAGGQESRRGLPDQPFSASPPSLLLRSLPLLTVRLAVRVGFEHFLPSPWFIIILFFVLWLQEE